MIDGNSRILLGVNLNEDLMIPHFSFIYKKPIIVTRYKQF